VDFYKNFKKFRKLQTGYDRGKRPKFQIPRKKFQVSNSNSKIETAPKSKKYKIAAKA